ncbi:MAG: bifunctional phosphopantothenoylcysteine decarboxylase/phosphopantothenate--cysteine ligase CoaBC, partial [Robiginitalea sp.]
GRMAEPEEIVSAVEEYLRAGQPLLGKKFLITAGPTQEAIDPVRFIGNHSSGKLGFALASAAAELGASVTLISGPTHLEADPGIHLIRVTSALEMYTQAVNAFPETDVVIGAAAVADYRPEKQARHKLKKEGESLELKLVRNPDIIAALGEQKTTQFVVGFALETRNELEYAKGKLREKHLDAVVLNSLKDAGAGFGAETNKVTFIDKNLEITPFELKTKAEVARDILHEIYKRLPK